MSEDNRVTYDAEAVIANLGAQLAAKSIEVTKLESALGGLSTQLAQAMEQIRRQETEAATPDET